MDKQTIPVSHVPAHIVRALDAEARRKMVGRSAVIRQILMERFAADSSVELAAAPVGALREGELS